MCLNPPRLAAVCALIQAAMPLNSFVLISRGSTDTSNIFSPDFLHFFFFFFNLAARTEQRQQPALEPFDVPLERMCRTTTYSDAFFFPTGGSKEERCGRISCERAFPLRQPHNSLPVCGGASQRTGRLAGKISLHLLTHTMASGDYRK